MIRHALASMIATGASGAAALADTGGQGWAGHGPGMMGHGGWGGWLMGPLMMLIFIGLIVGAVVLAVRLTGGDVGPRRGGTPDRSLQILRERYAKGEIDAEEFEARRRTLDE